MQCTHERARTNTLRKHRLCLYSQRLLHETLAETALDYDRNTRGILVLRHEGGGQNNLFHHGRRVFNPSGAEAVRMRFEPATGVVRSVIVEDGPVKVTALRQPQ